MSQIGITPDVLSFDKHIGDGPLVRLRQQFHLNDGTVVFGQQIQIHHVKGKSTHLIVYVLCVNDNEGMSEK